MFEQLSVGAIALQKELLDLMQLRFGQFRIARFSVLQYLLIGADEPTVVAWNAQYLACHDVGDVQFRFRHARHVHQLNVPTIRTKMVRQPQRIRDRIQILPRHDVVLTLLRIANVIPIRNVMRPRQLLPYRYPMIGTWQSVIHDDRKILGMLQDFQHLMDGMRRIPMRPRAWAESVEFFGSKQDPARRRGILPCTLETTVNASRQFGIIVLDDQRRESFARQESFVSWVVGPRPVPQHRMLLPLVGGMAHEEFLHRR
mmetsp:Transcript_5517/g.16352  ORF Transcript_5517/g.16352 Transcript_5517/m.16352 type:complete len:257 (-) Transcript_5517:153-923(-)